MKWTVTVLYTYPTHETQALRILNERDNLVRVMSAFLDKNCIPR
jgi:hypothetical protein